MTHMEHPLTQFHPWDKWIPKDELEVGVLYLCKARNFLYGRWNGEEFEYMRNKWGSTFPDTELHWDDGPPYGTVKPFKKVSDDEVDHTEY